MLCPLTAYLLVTTPYAIMIAAGVINVGEPAVPPLTMSGSIESPRGVWASRYSRDLERLADNSPSQLLIYMQYDDYLCRGTAVGDASVSWYVSVLGMP